MTVGGVIIAGPGIPRFPGPRIIVLAQHPSI